MFWKLYNFIFSIVLVISVFGLMYVAMLAGPVIKHTLQGSSDTSQQTR